MRGCLASRERLDSRCLTWLRSLRLILRTYAHRSAAVRLHTAVRFLTCPFLRVVSAIPPEASSLLELGAGHGVFSVLARDSGVARVIGAEPDVRKIGTVPPIRLVCGFISSIRGRFDAVAMIDVMYVIPKPEWDELLAATRTLVRPGGTLLLKEQDPAARIKNGWNRVQEWLSATFLGITLAKGFAYESREEIEKRLRNAGFDEVRSVRIDAGYPHPHVLYIAR